MSKSFIPEGSNETPFNKQTEEYQFFFGESFKENRQWRLISLVSLSAVFVAFGIVLYAINLPKTVPLVITVSEFGETKYVGDISRFSYNNIKVPENALQFQVREFVTNMYSISSDSEVMTQNLKRCYSMMNSSAASKFTDLLKQDNPYKQFGTVKKNVFIESVLKISEQSYQVDFIITVTTMNGSLKERGRFRSSIVTGLFEPQEKDTVNNPLGIYITDFDITKINSL